MFLFWNDKVIGCYCLSPIKQEEYSYELIRFLKKEMPECVHFRIMKTPIKSYRGNKVRFVPRLELVDCFHSGKSVANFYRDSL